MNLLLPHPELAAEFPDCNRLRSGQPRVFPDEREEAAGLELELEGRV